MLLTWKSARETPPPRSSVVELLLLKAKQRGQNFHVVVVDSRPELEGRGLLEVLNEAGVACTYVLLNAVSYAMMVRSMPLAGPDSP